MDAFICLRLRFILLYSMFEKHSELKNAWNAARKQYYADAERNNWF